MKNDQQRQTFIACRVALRTLLGSLTGILPGQIQIQISPEGKPYVAEMNIDFSLSHTPASFLIGITPDGAIGVDMELLDGTEDLPSIVAWAFTEKESIYCDLGKDKKKFLEIWTAKEALLKLTGRGISTDLKQLCTLTHIFPDYLPQMVKRKRFTAPGGETCCVLLQNSNSCG